MPKEKDVSVNELVDLALSGSIDRRRFMQAASALGVTVTAASAVWSNRVKAATPEKGGTFRAAFDDGSTTDQLDPHTTGSQFMIQLNHATRNLLIEITEDNVVGPDIAQNWEATSDAKTWTFELRKSVEFHNGKSFTAEDAVASLNYHRGEGSKSAAKSLVDQIADIRADGSHTVVVELKTGNADLPYVLADYHLVMLPSDGAGGVDTSGAGTGAYVLDTFEPGVRAYAQRNPNYFKNDKGHFDAVEMLAIRDVVARQAALVAGDVDAIASPDLKTLSILEKDPNVEVDEVASGTHCTMPMFVDQSPFDNLDLRMALKYGIDRESVVQKILRGHGVVGNDHPIGPTLPYWADLEQREYDPDRAKHHVKKAGMEGASIDISASDAAFSGAVDMCVLYREHLAKTGINLNIVREPTDGYWSNVWLAKPFCVAQWGARPTPDVIFSLAYAADAAWNESRYKGDRFNKLLTEARAELDGSKRAELYREMQQICRDEAGTIVPFFQNRVYARRSNVRHSGKLSANFPLDGARAAERWWFAS